MTTIGIDRNILNDLLDNQKKLDDVFDSIFDEDPFLDSSPTSAEYAVFDDSQSPDTYVSFNDSDTTDGKPTSTMQLIIPVALEIAVIYYGITYLL